MRGKILLALGLGIGYVLGTRAGREKYDELVAKVQKVWNDPRVQKQASNVGDFVKEKAPAAAEFLSTNVTKPAARAASTPRTTAARTTTRSAAKPAKPAKPAARKTPTAKPSTPSS